MSNPQDEDIIDEFRKHLSQKDFPCIGAKTALASGQLKCMVAYHMGCPHQDGEVLQFIYDFVDQFRNSGSLYHSAAVLFRQPVDLNEEIFEKLLWERLQSLSDLDALQYAYDPRVSENTASPYFSFSLKSEAFFIIGLKPESKHASRRFTYPAIIFNPHLQFQTLRETEKYNHLKSVIRKRDIQYSGTINPVLKDFGEASEVFQYSGRLQDENWQCPLKINHGKINPHTTAQRSIIHFKKEPVFKGDRH